MKRPDHFPFSASLWTLPLLVLLLTAPLWLHWWEPAMFATINGWCRPVFAPVWTGLSMLGNGWSVLALTAPLMLLAPRQMWAWLCAAPFAMVFARLGKWLIVSPRPASEMDFTQIRIVGPVLRTLSMPSGHTTTVFAVVAAILFSLPAAQRRRYLWLWLVALATGLSRVAVGAHWPGDVAVGIALGLWSGLLGNVLLVKVPQAWNDCRNWPLRCVALLVAAAVYVLSTSALDFDENLPLEHLLAILGAVTLAAFLRRTLVPKS